MHQMPIFLCSPLCDIDFISVIVREKTEILGHLVDRLKLLFAQDTLLLLRHSLAIPKFLYTLRTSPCFLSPLLGDYDHVHLLRATVSTILNIHFGEDDPSWIQATLPVCCSGLGIRNTVQLAPSAFLALAASCHNLVHYIIPNYIPPGPPATLNWSEAQGKCASTPNLVPPVEAEQKSQRAWDIPRVTATMDDRLDNTVGARSCAHILAATSKESGAWLQALPLSSIGLHMDDNKCVSPLASDSTLPSADHTPVNIVVLT